MISKEDLMKMDDKELQRQLDERLEEKQKRPRTFSDFSGQLDDEIADIKSEQKRRLIDDILGTLD